jgi:hypothetical protein
MEAARIEVEGPKVGLEVDVEPLTSCCLRVLGGAADQFGANTTALPFAARLRIEQERVVSTVPGDVDEPDENAVAGARCHPAETVRSDLVPPARFRSPAVGVDQLDHLVVGDRVTPRVDELVAHVRQPGMRAARGMPLPPGVWPSCPMMVTSDRRREYLRVVRSVASWAREQRDVVGVAVVGSWTRTSPHGLGRRSGGPHR